ncbi:MAG TPA: hypothetical protein EYP04_02240, partial [Anaerolineae bacterium]|nr:hypothetical protein [Anaerolineae bacterium]
MAQQRSKSGNRSKRSSKSSRSRTSSRRPKRRRSQAGPGLADTLGESLLLVLQDKVLGVILALIAGFTALSLLTTNRGSFTQSWIDHLTLWFGAGVWLVPLWTGYVGLWLVLRGIRPPEKQPAWQPLAGVLLLLIAFQTAAHLLLNVEDSEALARSGGGGGLVGWVLSDTMHTSLGFIPTIMLLLVMLFVGLILIAGLTLDEVSTKLKQLLQRPGQLPEEGNELPELPLLALSARPSVPSRWRQWLSKLRPPSKKERPLGETVLSSTPTTRAVMPSPALASTKKRPKSVSSPTAASPASAPQVSPRVIGSELPVQIEWQLPDPQVIFDLGVEHILNPDELRRRVNIILE